MGNIFISRRTSIFPRKQYGADPFAYELLILPITPALRIRQEYGSPIDLHSISSNALSTLAASARSLDSDPVRALWSHSYDETTLSASQAKHADAKVGDFICVMAFLSNSPGVEHWIYTQVDHIVPDERFGLAFAWVSAEDIAREFEINHVPNNSGPKDLLLMSKQDFPLLALERPAAAKLPIGEGGVVATADFDVPYQEDLGGIGASG